MLSWLPSVKISSSRLASNAFVAAFGKNFFLALGKAYYRQFVQPQPADNLQCAAQLPFAAVNNNQTRQILVILIASVHNFLHGFKIVRLAFCA